MQLFGRIYRRIEPKVIKFSVSYYPKASEYDPEPSMLRQKKVSYLPIFC